jgi:hypothetical protein
VAAVLTQGHCRSPWLTTARRSDAMKVYGGCTQLREFFRGTRGLPICCGVMASILTLTLAPGTKLTFGEAVRRLARHKRGREVRSARKGSKSERWYAWAWIATARPGHHLLLAAISSPASWPFTTTAATWPERRSCPRTPLIRTAGLRWPAGGRLRTRRSTIVAQRGGSAPSGQVRRGEDRQQAACGDVVAPVPRVEQGAARWGPVPGSP